MDDIKDVSVGPLKESLFVRPFRMNYTQNGQPKTWDLVSLHESVSILIFNTDRQKVVLVKQFRPAVYYSGARCSGIADGPIDFNKCPGTEGITLELCAGIVDKKSQLAEIARGEVLEECGYDAPLENFREILTYRSGVGVSGDKQTIFYAEVTDKMKMNEGGGLASEGEMIEVVEMSIPEVQAYLKQREVNSPGGLLFALMWFLQNRAPKNSLS